MNFLLDNLGTITIVIGALYPPLLYLLPVATAQKINIGVKVFKTVAEALEKAQNTKGGLSLQDGTKTEIKTFTQKAR